MRTLNLFLLFFFIFALNSYSLPECTGEDSDAWDLCIGENAGYVGEYKAGKYHGQGTMIRGYIKYVGGWRDGRYHGKGTYTYLDGTKYVGEYKDGKKHGKGTYTEAHKGKYVGEFEYDKYDGKGTYTYLDGRQLVGKFIDGRTYSQVTVTYPNGSKYVGEWTLYPGTRHGKGTMTYSDSGREISGIWNNGKFIE